MEGQKGRAEWDKEMERVLINGLVLQARLGKRAESGFKKEAWEGVRSTLNSRFSRALTVAQVKNKITVLKRKFVVFQALKDRSGFGWNENDKIVTAPNDVWNDYLAHYPEAKEFRFSTLSNYDELSFLFGGVAATGRFAFLLGKDPPQNCFTANYKDIDEDNHDPPFCFGYASQHNSPAVGGDSYQWSDTTITQETSTPVPSGTQFLPISPTIIGSPITLEKSSQNNGADTGTCPRKSNTSGLPKRREHTKRERASAGQAIASSLRQLSDTAREVDVSKMETAIILLQQDYGEQYTDDEMASAFSVFENEIKAKMFVAMKKGNARDLWMRKEIGKVNETNETV